MNEDKDKQTVEYHIPALLNETILGLKIQPGGIYVDVTLGGGGHSGAILEELKDGNGKLFSFDQDMDALENAKTSGIQAFTNLGLWQFVHSNFRYLRNFMDYYGVEQIDGLLADLGVSFHHFDCPERGFSFRYSAPLDMRMNQTGGKTAADILNTYSEEELARVLYIYGELKNAKQLARRIVKTREDNPLARTEDLVSIVLGKKVQEFKSSEANELDVPAAAKKDMAKVFQALRIEVNDEMASLKSMLKQCVEILKPGGRIVVLTYHSLEDRIVKDFFRYGNFEGKAEKDFFGRVLAPLKQVNNKVIVPSDEEVERNPRSRSAKLRIAEKL